MKPCHVSALNIADAVTAECGIDKEFDCSPVFVGCAWFAVLRNVLTQKSCAKCRYGDHAFLVIPLRCGVLASGL